MPHARRMNALVKLRMPRGRLDSPFASFFLHSPANQNFCNLSISPEISCHVSKLNINFWWIKAWLSTVWTMTSFEINSSYHLAPLWQILDGFGHTKLEVGYFGLMCMTTSMLFSVLQGSVPCSLFFKLLSVTSLKRNIFYPLVCVCDLQISWRWFHDWQTSAQCVEGLHKIMSKRLTLA